MRHCAGHGGPRGHETSILKLFHSQSNQALQNLGLDLEGMKGIAHAEEDPWAATSTYGFLRVRSATIAGGTSEIQRNILGEKVLGLPREPAAGSRAPMARGTPIVTSGAPAVEPRTPVEMFAIRLADDPDAALLLTADGVVRSYRQIGARADRLADQLRVRGVMPGDVVGLYLGNEPNWVVSALASWWCGCTIAACGTVSPRHEAERRFRLVDLASSLRPNPLASATSGRYSRCRRRESTRLGLRARRCSGWRGGLAGGSRSFEQRRHHLHLGDVG